MGENRLVLSSISEVIIVVIVLLLLLILILCKNILMFLPQLFSES